MIERKISAHGFSRGNWREWIGYGNELSVFSQSGKKIEKGKKTAKAVNVSGTGIGPTAKDMGQTTPK